MTPEPTPNEFDPPPIRPFEESLPMALLRAREATMQRFRPLLANAGLTEQQWRTLRALSAVHAPLDVGEIADATFLLGPSLSRILSNLDERQLIKRATDPEDQRRTLISLTAKGRKIVAKMAPQSESQYDEIERLLGKQKLHELLELLNALEATSPAAQPHNEELAS